MVNNLTSDRSTCDAAHAPVIDTTAIDSFWNSAVKNDLFAMAYFLTVAATLRSIDAKRDDRVPRSFVVIMGYHVTCCFTIGNFICHYVNE